ncbi:addiction module protein [Marinobacter subterrani]|uniref:addiction module protein n=1 Tax=Marinobacter subterrani TaxID=1658765 RepID=UPI003B5B246C
MEIQSLTVSERIILAEALWDSVVAEGSEIELTDAQKLELDRRLKSFELDEDRGGSWADVKARILSK